LLREAFAGIRERHLRVNPRHAITHKTLRHQEDPPDESYEAAWREALGILERAGPDAGFILVTAHENEEGNLDTFLALSGGRDRIPEDTLIATLALWLDR